MIYFTADLHFGHENIIKYDNRPFNNVEKMDAELIRRWNNKVKKDDIVYVLGDISWYNNEKTANICKQLNGEKHLIKGNHDRIGGKVKACFESIADYAEIRIDDKKLVLCHYPIHMYNGQHQGAIMLYGHVHNSAEDALTQNIKDRLHNIIGSAIMYNVGCMHWDYEPVSLSEIL